MAFSSSLVAHRFVLKDVSIEIKDFELSVAHCQPITDLCHCLLLSVLWNYEESQVLALLREVTIVHNKELVSNREISEISVAMYGSKKCVEMKNNRLKIT